MDKELIKKLVAQGNAYVLDLRGGSVPGFVFTAFARYCWKKVATCDILKKNFGMEAIP